MKTLYGIMTAIGLLLAMGSTAISIAPPRTSFVAGLLLSNPPEWSIQFLHTPSVPALINPETAKAAILEGLRSPRQDDTNARAQMLTIGLLMSGFSIVGLIRERQHARRIDASNKGLLRTGDPRTARQSAEP